MLRFDFSEIEIGLAQSEHKDTGCTVVRFPRGSIAAVDIRGGAVAARETANLEESSADAGVDAIVLAGGSTYGLEAASGVMLDLFQERQFNGDFSQIPSVPSAIVYDFRNRSDKKVYPNREMGQQAHQNRLRNMIPTGRVGAGTNVWVGKFQEGLEKEQSGQGAAFSEQDGIKVLCISVVNAMGNILDHQGKIVRGSMAPNGNRVHFQNQHSTDFSDDLAGNTTISLLVTNLALSRSALKRLAIMTHTSMARVIEPFHTAWDGDVFFAVSTGSLSSNETSEKKAHLLAIETIQKAVLNSF